MVASLDSKLFEAFAADPASLLSKLADFQRANFDAARQIAEINADAFQQLAAIRDPQQLLSAQTAILQAALQRDIEVMTGLWQSLAETPGDTATASTRRKK